MTDAGFTISGEALSRPGPLADGAAARAAEQVSIEADRLSGTVQDGVEAAGTASKTYAVLLTDACAKMMNAAVRSNLEISNHLLALMRARTPFDACRMNLEFIQEQAQSTQDRLCDAMGIARPEGKNGDRIERRA